MITKKSYLYERFFVSSRNFTTEYVEIVKNSRFFKVLCSKFNVFLGYFCLNCQILGFSMFPVKMATLITKSINLIILDVLT